MSVLVPPLPHLIRLAEDTATMDLLSGGRLDVGYGQGGENFGRRPSHQSPVFLPRVLSST